LLNSDYVVVGNSPGSVEAYWLRPLAWERYAWGRFSPVLSVPVPMTAVHFALLPLVAAMVFG
jgi:hypothetical protein